MALAAWLAATGRSDCFIVLAEAAIWPGRHDASSFDQLMREDARNRIEGRDLGRYPPAFEQDLETMPPKVVLGRIVRFLRNDLREVLTHADWQSLPWHTDNRCLGCGYLGYSWSTADDEEIGVRQASQRVQERRERWCWPVAERDGHTSRIARLTEGASGKLREGGVVDVAGVAGLSPGHRLFETHQTLRSKRTVLVARGQSLANGTPAAIPDRAGTSAVMARFVEQGSQAWAASTSSWAIRA